jgi:hypothetical protein
VSTSTGLIGVLEEPLHHTDQPADRVQIKVVESAPSPDGERHCEAKRFEYTSLCLKRCTFASVGSCRMLHSLFRSKNEQVYGRAFVARYRDRHQVSGAKSDAGDAKLLADLHGFQRLPARFASTRTSAAG